MSLAIPFRALVTVAMLAGAAIFAPALQAQHAQHAHQDTRVFELRTYTAAEGRLDDVVDRFRQDTMVLLAEFDMESIGYWIPQDPERSQNTLMYMLAHPSREAARENWQAFFADERWIAVRDRTEANGRLVERVESVFFDPTDFSPLQ